MNRAGTVFPPGSSHLVEKTLQTAAGFPVKDCTKFDVDRQTEMNRKEVPGSDV